MAEVFSFCLTTLFFSNLCTVEDLALLLLLVLFDGVTELETNPLISSLRDDRGVLCVWGGESVIPFYNLVFMVVLIALLFFDSIYWSSVRTSQLSVCCCFLVLLLKFDFKLGISFFCLFWHLVHQFCYLIHSRRYYYNIHLFSNFEFHRFWP